MADGRRAAASELAEELLTDFELGRLSSADLVRRTSRLARLLDDQDALTWLRYEIEGFGNGAKGLSVEAFAAARRSGRVFVDKDGGSEKAYTSSVGELEAAIRASNTQIAAAADAPVSVSSANPHQFVSAPAGNTHERVAARNQIVQHQGRLDRVLGVLHTYISDRYYELRFGAAIENAFEKVRSEVDNRISSLVPSAVNKLAAAFENVASDNPEQWANAASTCRRLLKAVADELRPAGPDIHGRKMGDSHYINRLVDWVTANTTSTTGAAITASDLEHLGKRLDAADDAGHKGAHAEVAQFEAARSITGTYLLLGDILRIHDASPS